ncbi:MAG: ChaB family protein [Patescibacteria group bacterium]
MPYSKITELPESVKNVLPTHAQDIYMNAFNSAWYEYDKPSERQEGRDREETAHAVAWSAVKSKYKKDESTGKWVEKSRL